MSRLGGGGGGGGGDDGDPLRLAERERLPSPSGSPRFLSGGFPFFPHTESAESTDDLDSPFSTAFFTPRSTESDDADTSAASSTRLRSKSVDSHDYEHMIDERLPLADVGQRLAGGSLKRASSDSCLPKHLYERVFDEGLRVRARTRGRGDSESPGAGAMGAGVTVALDSCPIVLIEGYIDVHGNISTPPPPLGPPLAEFVLR